MSTSIDFPRPSSILFGKSRGAVLSLLFSHVDEAFYLRQIARLSGYGLGPVQRELRLLTDAGIIRRSVSGRQVYFRANRESPIFPELKSLIAKTVGVGDTLRNALSPITNLIKAAFIFGSAAKGEEKSPSDIDLLIVGEVSFSDTVINLQAAQKALGREVNPTCIFWSNPASDSGSKWPLILVESGHRFWSKTATFRPGPESSKSEAALDNLTLVGHHVSSPNERRTRCRERGYPCVRSKKCCG